MRRHSSACSFEAPWFTGVMQIADLFARRLHSQFKAQVESHHAAARPRPPSSARTPPQETFCSRMRSPLRCCCGGMAARARLNGARSIQR